MNHAAILAGLLLSFRHVGAFMTQSSCIRSTAATSQRQHDTSTPFARHGASSAAPLAKPTRRRHTYRTISVSGTAGDSGESAEPEDGGIEEERSIPEGVDRIPSASSDGCEEVTPPQARETVEAANDQDVTAASEADAISAKEDTAEETREGVDEAEDDGEPLFLPSGDNKDFRLFRAKLRAGSDDKWREQLKRNVNEAQLAGQDAWAHELSTPEKGCLIIAKSGAFNMAQTYFNEVSFQLDFHNALYHTW